ncbi:MAG: chemotaxis protein CheD [Candidatus Brocadiia bacterium]|nr:MAG: chemotaxis protein CheD [Candidatus Brocadiia bacterium]
MSNNKIIVHVSDAKVSRDPNDVLVTYSLGSCIGVCIYDSVTNVGGMLHYQLPDSTIDPEKAREKPFMFADTGLALLIQKMISMGAEKKRLQVKIAGGANMDTGPKGFDIGKRNHMAIRKIMWKNGIFIAAEDIGGNTPRNMYLNMGNGAVTVKANQLENVI